MVLSTGEPTTCIAQQVADDFLRIQLLPAGRRVIPSDAGPVIARTLQVQRLIIPTIAGGLLEFQPWTMAVSTRPRVLGVGGLLGGDILTTFQRITYEFGLPDPQRGPRDTLTLERDP